MSLLPKDMYEVAPGIFYTDSDFVCAGPEVVEILRQTARKIPARRARLCAHPHADAEQQDMLIVSDKTTYVAPHRHFEKSESLTVLEGEATAIIFDDKGAVRQTIQLGPVGSMRAFFYRMPSGLFHSLVIESEQLIFVESTKGPFAKADSEDAPWAPSPQDVENGVMFLKGLLADKSLATNQ